MLSPRVIHAWSAIVLGLTLTAGSAKAALTISESSPGVWEIQFDDLVFTSLTNTGGSYDWLIFEDFWATNATGSGSENGTETISVSINGGPASDRGLNSANGTFASTNGALDPNDFLINIAAASIGAVSIGQEVVVSMSAGGLTFNMNPPAVTASPTVTATFWSNSGVQQTNSIVVSTIPEPSAALLGVMGGLMLLRRRR